MGETSLRQVSFLLLLLMLLMGLMIGPVTSQRTSLDEALRNVYRPLRLLGLAFTGRSGDDEANVQRVRNAGKTQKSNPRTRALLEFCDAENGPGRRSDERPTSVHRLRPGDIDIIGAMGDSLTAGNGVFATNLGHVTVENRGVVWSIGGQDNWRKYLTLPNILKEFNPNLYGYSLKDGLSTERSSRFNVAELAAMSRDMPYMAKVLVKRMQRDPNVNMTHDWKLITMFIGNNDFCTDICYYPQPELTVTWHKQNMLKTYRYLRDNVPRLLLNVVPAPNLRFLTKLSGLPSICQRTLSFECPCLIGKAKQHLDYYEPIMKRWIAQDYEIVNRTEFNTETFTINVQPFSQFDDFPRTRSGKTDTRFFSEDCFHLSQRGHASAANAIWNNMLEMPDKKSGFNSHLFEKFNCPTEERPFFLTRENIRDDFVI
ncbi:phospholipase B1, membrane-associated [Drosophila grimshawi]|uniref:Phospholipase B1, membrane-associated n=1 Tax=Drosophila grimshawi TaxID=7222 RepID=B4IYS7_DROGR|nr:phospholipase B1, membrane-associated [Drosophila grimshawi]EDV96614.1 GH16351 [Drosophila grimshawi]